MIIYNPRCSSFFKGRLSKAESILKAIPVKNCFITGSFLHKNRFEDIDIFLISRTKKNIKIANKKANVQIIDFNALYSLFFHSITKRCVAKNILPIKPLKVTLTDYWHVLNDAIPTLMNQKSKYHKHIRFLILYTEYFKTGEILDTYQLWEKINGFRNYRGIMDYVREEVPFIMQRNMKKSYLKRFFYTQAGYYKDSLTYDAQRFLYDLTHLIVGEMSG